jgi:hypothetical protein
MIQYFLYLIEASICLSLFYVIYWLLIKDDTFYRLKRYYLLATVILSMIIPLLPATSLTKGFEKSILPVKEVNVHNSFSQNNFEKIVFGNIPDQPVNFEHKKSFTLLSAFFILYVSGAAFMLFRFLYNLWQLQLLVMKNELKPYGKYSIISLSTDYPTFSFFRYIFFNDDNLSPNDKNDILMHEEIHIKQWHSLDIIFIEICKIMFWFIPVIWQYKTSLSKVHECLADQYLVELKSDRILDYQSLLLKQYLSNIRIELAHPFNFSLIKFRINMMTKTKSMWWAKYKLLFAVPIIILSLVAFSNDNLTLTKEVVSMNTNSQGHTRPDGWFLSGARPDFYKTGIDNQASQHGQNSGFIESVIKNPDQSCTLMQICNVKELKGKRVKMTGYIKSQGLSDTALMWLRIDDFDKKMVTDFDNMHDRPIIGNKDWTKCEIIFDVPISKCAINFGFILSGEGKIWFDNVSFEVVSGSTEKTAFALNELLHDEYLNQIPQELPEKMPVNLDFED